jgi:hypothetical protein
VLYLRSDQIASKPAVTALFETPIEYLIQRVGAPDTTIRVMHDQGTMFYAIPMGGTDVSGLIVDPQNWIVNAVGVIIKDPALGGIKDPATALQVYLYPNPASESVQIAGYEPTMHILVYDYTGKEINTPIHNDGTVDLTQVTSGVYQIHISDERKGADKSLRFVKL